MQTAVVEENSRIEEAAAATNSVGRFFPCRLVLGAAVLAVVILAATGMSFWLSHPMLIYPDQALYVHMAQLLMQGKVPYVEMFDNNPPLAFYLQIVPVCLASLFHIAEPLAFSMYIWGLILFSCTVCGAILWRSANRGAICVGLAATLGFVFFNQHQVIDFGQREHIFAILYLPFFILRYLRWQGLKIDRSAAVLIGIMAGVGIALKHYFLLVALAPELVWAIERRAVRPFFRSETVALSLTISLYLAHFLFLPRAELQCFFGFIVPIYKAGYSYYTTSMSYNLNTFWRGDFYLMALTTLGALALARQSSVLLPLQAFSLMSAVIYILAGQVWSYHVVPVRMANEIALFVQAFLLLRCLPGIVSRGVVGPSLMALCLVSLPGYMAYRQYCDFVKTREHGEMYFLPSLGYDGECPVEDINPFTQTVIDHSAREDSILFISSAMGPGYPVFLQSRRKPASRFLHAMILPMLGSVIDESKEPERSRYKASMQQILDWYGEDIAKNKPRLIFIQSNFIYGMLEQKGFFKKQMANYKLLQIKEDNRVYMRGHL